MKKVINIPEDVVNNIEMKDSKFQALSSILQSLIEAHLINTDTSFMTSPVVLKLQEQIAEARTAWENAKNDMALKYISKEDSERVQSWSLNYGTNELTLELL